MIVYSMYIFDIFVLTVSCLFDCNRLTINTFELFICIRVAVVQPEKIHIEQKHWQTFNLVTDMIRVAVHRVHAALYHNFHSRLVMVSILHSDFFINNFKAFFFVCFTLSSFDTKRFCNSSEIKIHTRICFFRH